MVMKGWGFTGNNLQRAVQSDAMQGKQAYWKPRPFEDALHCIDAPDWVPTTAKVISQGIVISDVRKREGESK